MLTSLAPKSILSSKRPWPEQLDHKERWEQAATTSASGSRCFRFPALVSLLKRVSGISIEVHMFDFN